MGNMCKSASSKKQGGDAPKVKPKCPFKVPIEVEVEQGKSYYWCTCGESKNQPWCDGSHAGTSFKPLKYDPTETKKEYLCQCKRTEKPPFCDGSHLNPHLDW